MILRARSLWVNGAIAILLASLGLSCSVAKDDEQAAPGPLVRLLISPDDVFGKRIQTIGFLQKGLSLRLFLTMDHAVSQDIQSSIIVRDDSPGGALTKSSCLDHYVRVTGRFELYMGAALAIVEVEKVERADTREICWQRQ